MTYIASSPRSARVIDVSPHEDGNNHITAAIEGRILTVKSQNDQIKVGDIFLVSEAGEIDFSKKIGRSKHDLSLQGSDVERWRKPNALGQTRYSVLWQRQCIRRSIQSYMDKEGFLEVDIPLLVRGTTPDAAINSFEVGDFYLATSTEYQIKRMISGGFDQIYTLTQNFRCGDGEGPYRNQEFTMLEWARVGVSLDRIENDAEKMVLAAHRDLGGSGFISYNNHIVDLSLPWDRVTVAFVIEQATGVRIENFTREEIQEAVAAAKINVGPSMKNDIPFLFSVLMDHIQPQIGCVKPVFVQDWPSFETSSALEKDQSNLVERSELFIAGVEISDGFPSLTDPDRQAKAFENQNVRRESEGNKRVSCDEAYLHALQGGLPNGAGMALGFDRLVMILTGRPHIRDVLAFSQDEL